MTRWTAAAAVAVMTAIAAPRVAAQARPTGQTVTGTAVDPTGAVLPNADVALSRPDGTAMTTRTDATGAFRFDAVPPGRYELRVAFEGFQPTTVRLTVGARAPAPLRIALPLAGVTQEITVSNQTPQVDTGAAANSDAITLDRATLESLPVLDQDLIAAVSRFLDAGAIGGGGVTVVVNGMEVSALRVSASAVQQIKINQDPYSAEYARPGRGRIEILTKPGSSEYHGEMNAVGRDAAFDARNAFAMTKPGDRRRNLEGTLGGPVGRGGRTSFLFSGHDQLEDQQAFVVAVGPAGAIADVVAQPNRQSLAAFSVTRQVGDKTTIAVRPNYEYESSRNRGAGGTTLASAATNFEHREEQVTYTQQTVVHPTLLAQFQILVGHEREPTVSVSADRGIVVAGAFAGGGAQADLLRTETHMQSTSSLAWTRGRHLVQTGFQLPDWSRRGFYDRTNTGGTFSFASLADYVAGRPYAFVQQRGDGDLAFLEKQVGAYVKDDWQASGRMTVSFGLRYDWQNYFGDTNNFAPRWSIAFAPGASKATVLRAGAGVFNDRSGPVAIADLLHYRPGGLTKIVVSNPGYPDPFSAGSGAAQPPSVVRLSPDVQIPRTLQYSAGIDRQLTKAVTVSVGYTGAHGYHSFRSRDVNAPPPPLYAARPDSAFGVVRQIESTGRQQTDSLSVTARARVAKWFSGQAQYSWSRAHNDTNGIASYPANDYDLGGEYALADFDRRHRMGMFGRVRLGALADLGVSLTANSAGPYTELLGQDVYNNGRGRARPAGVARNTLEGAGFASLDVRASRDIRLGGSGDERGLTLGIDAFNLTNRINYGSFVGTLGSPLFGRPTSARAPRQLQFSARIKF